MIATTTTLDDDEEKFKRICHSVKKFFYRYVLLMIFLIILLFALCKVLQHVYHRDDEKYYYLRKIIGMGLCLANATVPLINFIIIAIVLPVCRTFNKIIHMTLSRLSPRYLAVYLEKLKVVHQFLALTLIYVALIHITVHFVNAINFIKNYDVEHVEINFSRGHDDNVIRLMFLHPVGFSGWIMLACLIIMWIFSSRQMRDNFHNSFLGVHHLFILFYIMMFYHPLSDIFKYQDNTENSPPICDDYKRRENDTRAAEYVENYCIEEPKFTVGKKNFWIWPTIATTIFFIDHLFRYFKRFFLQVKPIEMRLPTRNAMFLTFKVNDNISLVPGQYILLQCENISTLEWHPFYIIDYVIEPKKTIFTVAISVRGDWTFELYEKVSELKMYAEKSKKRRSIKNRRAPRKLKFIMDGPFPNQAEAILANDRVVLIASGIGIVPFIAIFNYIMKTTKPTMTLQRIHLVWISRDIKQFSLFSNTLSDLAQMFWEENQPDRLQLRLYLMSNKRRSIFCQDFGDNEGLCTPLELFGEHAEFVMSRIYFDTPDWNFLFDYWASMYGDKPIFVFSCGSKTLSKDVRKACSDFNEKGLNFRFIHEAFS